MFDDLKYPEPDPNKKPAAVKWDERYHADTYLFGKEPVLLIKTYASVLRPGRLMDVGMGEGRNAVFLAGLGFKVEGIDCSARAIEKASRLAEEKKVTVEVKTQNLDFFLMPLMKFDSVVMTYLKPLPRFFSEIRRGLVAGGTVALEAYTVDHLKKNPGAAAVVDFEDCYKPNEVLFALKDFHLLYYKEMEEGGSCIVQAIARKKS